MVFIKTFFRNIKNSKYFELFSIAIILSAAIIYGVETFQISDALRNSIFLIDYLITIIFSFEIGIRMFGEKRIADFFKDPWNVFDFTIVSISLVPAEMLSNILIVRVVRVFRVMRLITHVPKFKSIISAFFKSVPRVSYVMALMFVIFYVYAILGSAFFEAADPDRWSNVLISLWTLFQVATFENWPDIMQAQFNINPYSWLFFFTFIILIAFILMNMIVGIIVDTISEENAEETRMEEEILKKLDELDRKISKL